MTETAQPAAEPAEQTAAPEKKGRPSWKPASRLRIRKSTPGFRERWCDKDPVNIAAKLEEGWEFCAVDHMQPKTAMDGKPLTTTTEYRELVAMRMPEELAKARNEYFAEMANQNERQIKRNLQDDARKVDPRAHIHGKIVIE